MGTLDRYIFRTTLTSFMVVLFSLTGVIWITQALRVIDLMTSQGQTILTFLGLTSLAIPMLVQVIAPIALMIGVAHTLTKLANDSEMIVMNAAGFSPLRLFTPFFEATCVVALLVAVISAYVAPASMRRLKQWNTDITTDALTTILQPGRFAQIEANLTVRIRERLPNGDLGGIFIDDQRNPKERVTFIAETGTVVKNDKGAFLILRDLQRFAPMHAPELATLEKHAFDMSQFASRAGRDTTTVDINERYLWELFSPPPDDPLFRQVPGKFRSELHDRISALFYPFAFAVLTFAFLGPPRTTRQSRNFSIGGSIVAVLALRMTGFACTVLAAKMAIMVALQYVLLALAAAIGLWMIAAGLVLEPPAALVEANRRIWKFLRRKSEEQPA
ncbi:MAG: LPS export ABC transporter permease LptF [Alphaproteobacteria bacterium]|nr:LPS export ABC transporter permease LptF [Alphaproteobacteria bacterium]